MKLTAIIDFLYKTLKKNEWMNEWMNDFQPKVVTEGVSFIYLSFSFKGIKGLFT